jgi:TRAP-type C4-dicarboxylate transport system permease small subunit
MIWASFIGASLCVRSNVHVSMNLLQTKLGPRPAKILLCTVYFLAGIFCLYFGFLGGKMTHVLFQVNQVSSTMEFLPLWVVNVCVPIFGILAAKNFIHLFILNLECKGGNVLTIPRENG